jgi:Nuclease-related domain
MDSSSPLGFGPDDADAAAPDQGAADPIAARQRRRLERRQARLGDGASAGVYDTALGKGIAGEERVGADLERRLAGLGCVVLHSLRFLGWGDIDHLVIGPGGITVVDAKNWSGTVTVRGAVPRAGRRSKRGEVDKLDRQLAGVRLALLHAQPALRSTSTRAVMCLAAEPEWPVQELRGGLLLAGSSAAAEVALRPGQLSADEIEQLRAVLVEHLPQVRRNAIDELLQPTAPLVRTATRASCQARRPRRVLRSVPIRVLGVCAALLVIASGLAAFVAAFSHLRFVPPAAAGPDLQLRLSHGHGHVVVNYTAAAGDVVLITLSGDGRRRRVRLHTTGIAQKWIGPRVAAATRQIHAQACVLAPSGRCTGAAARVSLRLRPGNIRDTFRIGGSD